MKNSNKKWNGIRSFVKEKGYYIVLLLCAVAVGVSGYFLLKDRTNAPQEPTVAVTSPAPHTADKTTAPAVDAAATEPGELPPVESGVKAPALRLMRPVQGDSVTFFAADFLAYNETTRDWRTHEGIDLSAALGQDVCAAAAGTVEAIYEDERLGMTVVLTHADGYTTHYSNLAETIAVKVGDKVAAGSVLGNVGQTACTESAVQPHVHFALYQNGAPVNPEDYFG